MKNVKNKIKFSLVKDKNKKFLDLSNKLTQLAKQKIDKNNIPTLSSQIKNL